MAIKNMKQHNNPNQQLMYMINDIMIQLNEYVDTIEWYDVIYKKILVPIGIYSFMITTFLLLVRYIYQWMYPPSAQELHHQAMKLFYGLDPVVIVDHPIMTQQQQQPRMQQQQQKQHGSKKKFTKK